LHGAERNGNRDRSAGRTAGRERDAELLRDDYPVGVLAGRAEIGDLDVVYLKGHNF